ncbi:EVE domain protein [Rhizoctonia solani 123E]|uniref:EVE domain protein n=1 Tax=Rhizoctonia solani 123E TaxID=1423351 RepID=A0A074S7X2_9AGAM|nr:EVE domain protein [Rhizoctonia solani 123E]
MFAPRCGVFRSFSAHSQPSAMAKYWLMKAEPDSRIVKGKDVKFSVDDFEACGTTSWEGVRNHEAKNIMRDQMKIGDKVLFYHSNCKTPGIAALAEVSKEAFPDYTANDATHPYYDPKSSSRDPKSEPTWWMVELQFKSRLKHFVSLAMLRSITSVTSVGGLAQFSADSEDGQHQLSYLSPADLKALGDMPLLNRGRLSVQSVNEGAWIAINKLAEKGGWSEQSKSKPAKASARSAKSTGPAKPKKTTKREAPSDADAKDEKDDETCDKPDADPPSTALRRSKRRKP